MSDNKRMSNGKTCPKCKHQQLYEFNDGYYCNGCKLYFTKEGQLKQHDRSKWPQVPYSKICMCPHCSHSTRDKCVEYNCQCCAERDARIMEGKK